MPGTRSTSPKAMVAWGYMTWKLLVKPRELSFGCNGSRSRMPPGPRSGNKSTPSTGRKRILLECQDKSEDHTFGTLLGRIKALFSSIVFGKSEQGTELDFGKIAGNKNPSSTGLTWQPSRETKIAKAY